MTEHRTAAVRAHFLIRGRVQGVWFRGSMQEEAKRLRIVGWVQNREDGSVEAEAEGERSAVDTLLTWAHHGPPAAYVEALDIEWGTAVGTETNFAVR